MLDLKKCFINVLVWWSNTVMGEQCQGKPGQEGLTLMCKYHQVWYGNDRVCQGLRCSMVH